MPGILVTHPAHFVRGPDRCVYAPETLLGYRFWTRYSTVFNKVTVAARVATASTVPQSVVQADGDGVEFCDLPDYTGPWQYARCRSELRDRLSRAVEQTEACCLRVPCPIAHLVWREMHRRGRPCGLEITGDPKDSLSPGAVRSLVRPLARWCIVRSLRAQCRMADATAYVTRAALQRRYPPAPDAFTTHYSSIELPADAIVAEPRTEFRQAHRLIYVGTLAVLYKAPDVLIRALAQTRRPELHLTMVGAGRERPRLEALARTCGLAGQITFTGKLPAGKPVRAALDSADLFVLPSRQEGLPRAMIEAMARSLPCIGSAVGGIPELLAAEDLVPPNRSEALANKITELLDDPDRLARAARRNLETAHEYLADVVEARRNEFYHTLLRISTARE
jgi:glycosyltransferase involved in cell wall biosynthesis